tara:strand:+ start:145 stop:327 length:183 start_codon:yes stop_codon:yes gene_type:complete
MAEQSKEEGKKFDDWAAVGAAVFVIIVAIGLVFGAAFGILNDEIPEHPQERARALQEQSR